MQRKSSKGFTCKFFIVAYLLQFYRTGIYSNTSRSDISFDWRKISRTSQYGHVSSKDSKEGMVLDFNRMLHSDAKDPHMLIETQIDLVLSKPHKRPLNHHIKIQINHWAEILTNHLLTKSHFQRKRSWRKNFFKPSKIKKLTALLFTSWNGFWMTKRRNGC